MCFYVTIFQVYVSRNQKKLLPPLLPGKMYSPSKQLAYSIMVWVFLLSSSASFKIFFKVFGAKHQLIRVYSSTSKSLQF